jgi:CarD family transcriptional regulator
MPRKTKQSYKVGDLIVYPSHGVGRIVSVGPQEIHGVEIELISILIEEAGLTLRVPKDRACSSGMRALAERPLAERALDLMTARPRGKSGTWNRRAQEYEKKIHSGDLLLAAEVVRDLRGKSVSYSEKQIYERALNRVSREVGQVLGRDPQEIRADVEALSEKSAA